MALQASGARVKSRMSQQEIRDLVTVSTGWEDDRAEIASAVAMAESGGRTKARGDGGSSRGLWQIYKPAHPDVSDACADDPGCAVMAMKRISSDGHNFNPWTMYRNGGYKRYMGKTHKGNARSLRGDAPGPLGSGDIPNPLKDFGIIADALIKMVNVWKDIFDWLTSGEVWLKIGELLVGVTLIFMGVKGALAAAKR